MERDFNRKPLQVFVSYYGKHKKLLIFDLAMAVFSAVADLAFPYSSRLAMSSLLPRSLFGTFFAVMGCLLLAYILRSLSLYLVTRYGHGMGILIEADMREDIYRKLQSLSFSYYDKNRTGKLMSHLTTDLFEVTELAHHGPENLLQAGLTLIGAFIVLLTIRWELAVTLFVLIPLLVVFSGLQRKKLRDTSRQVKAEAAEINTAIESGISGIRTVKAFANEAMEEKKFRAANDKYRGSKNSYFHNFGVFHGVTEFFMSLMQLTVICMGGYFIMKGRMDYVDLLTFSLYVSTFVSPIRKLTQFMEMFQSGWSGFTRFLDVMRTEPEIQDDPEAAEITGVKGDIEFRNVRFHYGENDDVLENINLTVPAGQTLALVGSSGGGKTTLSQLLPRFYDVSEGAVLLDGQDVRKVTQASLRKNVGTIQQDVFIFAGSIRDNIRYGRPDATDAEVEEAARLASIHEEILKMPEGYDTYVGERGVRLSGGQKQRISIARVFLKNPPVLILDEATSALDSVTEQAIQASLEQLSKGRTVIVVAHRLSTIRNADHIAVIENGRIAEYGTHEELLSAGGRYAGLWKAQQLL